MAFGTRLASSCTEPNWCPAHLPFGFYCIPNSLPRRAVAWPLRPTYDPAQNVGLQPQQPTRCPFGLKVAVFPAVRLLRTNRSTVLILADRRGFEPRPSLDLSHRAGTAPACFVAPKGE